jgi:hypothetical protein
MVLRARLAVGPSKDHHAEFRELGLDAVRKELLLRRWDPEKLAAARIWVESQDTHSWLAGRGDTLPPQADRKKRFRRWALYIVVAFGFAYAASRVLRSMNWW